MGIKKFPGFYKSLPLYVVVDIIKQIKKFSTNKKFSRDDVDW